MPYQLRLDIQRFQNKPAALPVALMSILGCSYARIFGYNACVGVFTGMEWNIILPTGTYAEATTEPLVTTYDEAESVLDVQE